MILYKLNLFVDNIVDTAIRRESSLWVVENNNWTIGSSATISQLENGNYGDRTLPSFASTDRVVEDKA